mmetsp:Transcript_102346/g.285152  ORF Transcript_102346/g.285152 Transcript_102346/m.285152 type:complete len:314 (-) Transcript_102346:224-1165(-)
MSALNHVVVGVLRAEGLGRAPAHGHEVVYPRLLRQHRGSRGGRVENEEEAHVHVQLHLAGIEVVGVVPEGVLDFNRDVVQGPQDEDLDEAEDGRPGGVGGPLRGDHRRDDPVQEEQGVAGLGIGEREGDVGDLPRLVQGNHAVGQLLEDARQDGRRDAEHPRLYVLHYHCLQPREDERHLVVALLQSPPAFLVQAAGVDELEVVGHDLLQVLTLLDLPQGHRVQQAEEAHCYVLEADNLLLWRHGVLAKGHDGGCRIYPLSAHLVRRCAAIPKPRVRLGCAEDNEETHKKREATPRCTVEQHVLLAEKIVPLD